MQDSLPNWATEDSESIRLESARYADMTPEERAGHLAAACRAAVRIARLRQDQEAVFNYQDPLPKSTVLALARLRREARKAQ